MIPGLFDILRDPEFHRSLLVLIIAGLLTGVALLVPSIAHWFDDRDS